MGNYDMTKEAYELKKQEKQLARQEQAKTLRKAKHSKALLWIGIFGVSAAILGTLIFFVVRSQAPSNLAGEFHASQGSNHLAAPYTNPPYTWATNPPTSGWHDPVPLSGGFYENPQVLPRILHSLEHGAVAVYYKPSVTSEDKEKLRAFYEKNKNKKLIISPLVDMATNFASTSWEYLDAFDMYDEARIQQFLDGHHDKGPERAPIEAHQ